MRSTAILSVLAALALLSLAAPGVAADPGPSGPFTPICPFITPFATVCVGGVLQCFVSVQFAGGQKMCLV